MAKLDPWTLRGIQQAKKRRRLRAIALPASVLVVGAVVGVTVDGIAAHRPDNAPSGYSETVSDCRVLDGDTLRCGSERIRLLGIDAPELPGHCRIGRDCVPGDPYASTDSLAGAIASSMTIERVGEDRYGRTLAMISGPKGDLSCLQIKRHQAVYKARWDNGLRVARTCPTNLW